MYKVKPVFVEIQVVWLLEASIRALALRPDRLKFDVMLVLLNVAIGHVSNTAGMR